MLEPVDYSDGRKAREALDWRRAQGRRVQVLRQAPDSRRRASSPFEWLARQVEAETRPRAQYFHEEAASAPREAILPEQNRVAQVISTFLFADSTRTLDDVWNANETSFFYAFSPDRGLARCLRPELKQSRTRITRCLAVNASGTERRHPLFIGKTRMSRCFKKPAAEHGFEYFFNKTAWMTMDIFATWLRSWSVALQQRDAKFYCSWTTFPTTKLKE